MKYLIFVSVFFIIFSGTSLSASAQRKINSGYQRSPDQGARPVKFIEGIEIKRNVLPASETMAPVEKTKASAIPETNNGDVEKILRIQFKYAQLLNKNVESVTNIPLFNFIDAWWEAPYHFGGTAKTGVDCSGFTGLLFSNVYATDIPRTAKEQYNASEKSAGTNLLKVILCFLTRGAVLAMLAFILAMEILFMQISGMALALIIWMMIIMVQGFWVVEGLYVQVILW